MGHKKHSKHKKHGKKSQQSLEKSDFLTHGIILGGFGLVAAAVYLGLVNRTEMQASEDEEDTIADESEDSDLEDVITDYGTSSEEEGPEAYVDTH